MSFPTLLCLHTLHTQGRIYMHKHGGYTCTTTCRGEVAEQRGCQVSGAKGAVSRLGALLKVNWHLSSYQLTPYFICFGPIRTWTGEPSVPRPSPYRLSHSWPVCRWLTVYTCISGMSVEYLELTFCKLTKTYLNSKLNTILCGTNCSCCTETFVLR